MPDTLPNTLPEPPTPCRPAKEARWLTVRLDTDESWAFLRLAARGSVLCGDGYTYTAQECRLEDDGVYASYYGERVLEEVSGA